MSPLNKLRIAVGLLALALLMALRFFWLDFNPNAPTIWILSFGWVCALSLGIISHQGASLSRASPWGALGLITTVFVGMLTLYVVGLPVKIVNDVSLLFFCITGCFIVIGWWRLFHRKENSYSKNQNSRPIFGLIFVLLAAYIALSKYF